MPELLFVAAVAVVAILIWIGVRTPWDPRPQTLAPVTLKSARAEVSPPLPRWFMPVALAGMIVLPVSAILGGVLEQPWIAGVGMGLYGVTWAARLGGAAWVRARTPLQRTVAILRPAALLIGTAVAAITQSFWWFLAAAAVYVVALLIGSRERRRQAGSAMQPPSLPRAG